MGAQFSHSRLRGDVQVCDVPVPFAISFHRNIINDVKNMMMLHALVEKFRDDLDFDRSRLESTDIELTCDDYYAEIDGTDPGDRYEDPSLGGYLDYKAHDTWRLVSGSQECDHIADLSDTIAIRLEDRCPGKSR